MKTGNAGARSGGIVLSKRKVVVVGLGRTGWDTARFLLSKGSRVYVTEAAESPELSRKAKILESEGARVELGGHSTGFLRGAHLLVPSPGVTAGNPVLDWAVRHRIPVLSEIDLAGRFCSSRRIIAITGTNGKTTTTALAGFLLEQAGIPCVVCGNIGETFIGKLPLISEETWVVVEASSFQLEYAGRFHPRIAILLNLTPDHLDRYSSMREYGCAKANIFRNQTGDDWAILNGDDSFCRRIAGSLRARRMVFRTSGRQGDLMFRDAVMLAGRRNPRPILRPEATRLLGMGNVENMLAVAGIGRILGIENSVIRRSLKEFVPLPHRMERVRRLNGVCYINDSKSTNVDSVRKALQSFPPDRRIVLIMGGKDKGLSFRELAGDVEKRVRLLILLGEARENIRRDLAGARVPTQIVANVPEAVVRASREARRGDSVLLSPGCSSFDMFKDYKERGNVFTETVQSLS